MDKRRIVIRDKAAKKAAIDAVMQIMGGEVLYEVVIQPHQDKRSIEQNARHWKRMDWLSKNVSPDSKESWHYQLVVNAGYIETTGRMKVGDTWAEFPIPKPTSKMGIKEFAEMEEKIDAFLGTELGITIPEPEEV